MVLALRVSSSDETVFSATPALEIGTQWGHPGGMLTRPYVRGGVSFYNDAAFPINRPRLLHARGPRSPPMAKSTTFWVMSQPASASSG